MSGAGTDSSAGNDPSGRASESFFVNCLALILPASAI